MLFDTTQQDWSMISIGVLIILASLSVVFVLKLLGLERWQIRKIGHIIINFVAAFYPYLFVNMFDIYISIMIAIGILLVLSAIPQVRILQRIFIMCARKESFPWELLINSVLLGIAMLAILWIFQDTLFVFAAAYLAVSLGDGLGEMVGRPYGKIRYKIFNEKSVEGSLAVLLGSFAGLIIALGENMMLGLPGVWWKIIVVAFIVMIVEAFSFSFSDNVTIPAAVAASLYLLFLL